MKSPLAHLVPTAPAAHGGSKGGPADDERHHQKRQEVMGMGAIILTGIRYGKHQFTLDYPIVNGQKICMAHCECGYEVEILYYKNYGGVKYLQKMWEMHIGTWQGWI